MSLQNKKVVVTRSEAQSAEFCSLLADAGAIPIAFPAIKIVPLPPEPLIKALQQRIYDWLVFTSVNAVNFYFAADPPNHRPAKIAAVGTATLAALEQNGVSADFVPTTFTASRSHGG